MKADCNIIIKIIKSNINQPALTKATAATGGHESGNNHLVAAIKTATCSDKSSTIH